MKKLLVLLLALMVSPLFAAGNGDDEFRQAVYNALDQAQTALKSAPFGSRTVAVLPFPGDDSGLFAGKLKNQLTRLGFKCVEGKEDPMWDEIVKEIAWNERNDDVLDPATLVKFGKLKSAQILLYGRVVTSDRNAERVYVEIELHATDLATKRHIWGGTFAARFYRGRDIQGIVKLDSAIKALLKESFAAVKGTMHSPEFAGKLAEVRRVAVIPLAGDIDEYMTGLAIEMLAETSHQPMRPDIPSRAQLRLLSKLDRMPADAVFYGAVRDLGKTATTVTAVDDKTMRESYVASVEIQLFLEDAKTGVILWSKTVSLSRTISADRPMTGEERDAARLKAHKAEEESRMKAQKAKEEARKNQEAARREKREKFGHSFEDLILDHWGKLLFGIVVLAVLVFAGLFVKAYLKNRTVR